MVAGTRLNQISESNLVIYRLWACAKIDMFWQAKQSKVRQRKFPREISQAKDPKRK
jgi:hypothetical protein